MKLFRDLSNEEKETFRQWARDNYQPFSEIDGCWHPAVQEECVRMNIEAEVDFPPPPRLINWAGQVCEVLEETPSKFRIRFENATGVCEMWLGKGAIIHKA